MACRLQPHPARLGVTTFADIPYTHWLVAGGARNVTSCPRLDLRCGTAAGHEK